MNVQICSMLMLCVITGVHGMDGSYPSKPSPVRKRARSLEENSPRKKPANLERTPLAIAADAATIYGAREATEERGKKLGNLADQTGELHNGTRVFSDLARQFREQTQREADNDKCCDCFFVGFFRCCPCIGKALDKSIDWVTCAYCDENRCLDCFTCTDCTPCEHCLDVICCSDTSNRR